jgi:PhzF family phenazine biosynthesis protein
MELIIYQVDAFTDRIFGGNPAAVIPLDEWLPDAILQRIAEENNLSETAFFVKQDGHYRLRWFTPAVEVELCGHATLASAYVLFNIIGHDADRIHFESLSGPLYVIREGERLVMDFPAAEFRETDIPESLSAAIGKKPQQLFESATKLMAVFERQEDILDIQPDFGQLKAQKKNLIITSTGKDCDFVSRFFAPSSGVDEDPVTGSAHTLLAPYWAAVLGRNVLEAKQVSKRGGELTCELSGDRVLITGNARLYMSGRIEF